MLRLTRQSDYGVILLTHFARNSVGPAKLYPSKRYPSFNARDLAEMTHLPLPMVSKILKILTQSDILESQRGPKGGYRLSRPPANITMVEVLNALEGPVAITDCSLSGEDNVCEQQSWCPTQANWQLVNTRIQSALDGISLADMAQPIDINELNLRAEASSSSGV